MKRFFKIIGIIILIPIIFAVGLISYLTVTEYYPKSDVNLEIVENVSPEDGIEIGEVKIGESFTILTWNIGYGALGDNADFFMDGGTSVMTADEERVNSNIANITSQILYQNPDIVLLQEVDKDSKRSYHLDEKTRIVSNMRGRAYTFALNFNVPYVPYPWPPIGKVESGLLTISDYKISNATRVQLPCPFAWPIRIANLKRCLSVNRMPIEDSDKELVIINLHLEAYDEGEGKAEQTEMLRDYMQKEYEAGNYVIAGGDFNQFFSSVDHSMYPLNPDLWLCGEIEADEFDPSWQFIMDNSVPSCRSLDKPYVGADKDNFQYYLIDGFIVSPNIEVIISETKDMGFVYTDHNPVFLKVKLK